MIIKGNMIYVMNLEAQELFDSIIKLNPNELTHEQVVFLHARRTYLNDDQMRVFGKRLEQYEEILENADKSEDEVVLETYKKEAKELGIKFDKNVTKEEILELIKEKRSNK